MSIQGDHDSAHRNRQHVLDRVLGKVCHTTSVSRFNSIRNNGAILANPPIPNDERWKTNHGEHYYPLVRHIGGVSLFDFREFEWEAYKQKHPFSSIHRFVPCLPEWDYAVWIEVCPMTIADNYISKEELLERWRSCVRRTIMPNLESAHIGDIPAKAFLSAFKVSRDGNEIVDLEIDDGT